jgi:DNA-binding HxlR family transcriptional regulator
VCLGGVGQRQCPGDPGRDPPVGRGGQQPTQRGSVRLHLDGGDSDVPFGGRYGGRDRGGEHPAVADPCPSREVFDLIADKWAGLLLNALDGQPLRHGELRRRIAGISQKMLTQTLRELERNGIVARTVTAEVPVRVDYALTPLGESLAPLLATLKLWAESHIAEIRAARETYAAGV